MAATALLFPVTTTSIDAVTFDATVSENHQNEAEVTEHPVETGANIADHKRPKPRVVTVEAVISNTPLFPPDAAPDPTRCRAVYDQLLALWNETTLIDVVTSIETYENMLVQSVSAPRTAKDGQSLRVTVVCKEIKQVALQVAHVTSSAQSNTQLGRKGGTTTPAAQAKTIAAQLTDSVVSGVKSVVGAMFK